jgi:hypothetical protein
MFEVQSTTPGMTAGVPPSNRVTTTPQYLTEEPTFMIEFQAMSLGELGRAALLERQETKYLFQSIRIADLLSGLASWYKILEIDNNRVFRYQSTYYDTPDLSFYHQHHRGASPRWKFRQRTYLESGKSYLEIKCKDNHKITAKFRQQVSGSDDEISPRDLQGFSSRLPFRPDQLQSVLQTNYSRFTLVSKTRAERVTLDFNLMFQAREAFWELPALLVIEVKQGRLTHQSAFIHRLREFGLRRTRFSKYCIGCALLNPGLKHNRFKPVLRTVDSIQRGVLTRE